MDFFIAELFDKSTTKNIYESITACINAEEQQLEYTLVYNNTEITNGLLFSWIYQKIFGIQPSKLCIWNMSDEFEVICNYMRNNTFFKYMAIDPSQFKSEFSMYKMRLFNDKQFMKRELFFKIASRFYPAGYSVMYDNNKTLYTLFKELVGHIPIPDFYKAESKALACTESLVKNPVTGMSPIPAAASADGMNACTQHDVTKYIVSKDHYLLRLLYQQNIFICTSKLPNVEGIIQSFNPALVLATYECDIDPDFVVTPSVLEAIPKIAKMCVSSSALSLAPSTLVLEVPINDKFAFDVYTTTAIKELQAKPISIPTSIMKCIFKKYMQIDSNINTKLVKDSKNSILIIDNRPNIMSVISAKITLSNLLKDTWSLVICTTEATKGFFQNYFPEAQYISHPLQNKKRFNIEDYNIMLKDSYLWDILWNNGKEKVLLIQDDAFVLKPGVESMFLEYDYVGAPWPLSEHLTSAEATSLVGNGGLSLRNVKVMLDVTRSSKSRDYLFRNNLQPIPEDVFFSAEITKRKGKIPTTELAGLFASEMILNKDSLGIHKPWGYFPTSRIVEMFFS